jgi:hypothetical protein
VHLLLAAAVAAEAQAEVVAASALQHCAARAATSSIDAPCQ